MLLLIGLGLNSEDFPGWWIRLSAVYLHRLHWEFDTESVELWEL